MKTRLINLIVVLASVGCAGETFPLPSPAALQSAPKSAFTEEQQAAFIQIARAYIAEQGKNPTPVIYDVQPPRSEEDDESQAPTQAVVVTSFQDGNTWLLAIRSDGTISRLTRH